MAILFMVLICSSPYKSWTDCAHVPINISVASVAAGASLVFRCPYPVLLCMPLCDMFMAVKISFRVVCRFPVRCIARSARMFITNNLIFATRSELHPSTTSPKSAHSKAKIPLIFLHCDATTTNRTQFTDSSSELKQSKLVMKKGHSQLF